MRLIYVHDSITASSVRSMLFWSIFSFSVSCGALALKACLSEQDAWFETAEVDESLQAKKIKEKEAAKEDTELTTEERWILQKRIANTLLPGETVSLLHAFRIYCASAIRLGHFRQIRIFQVHHLTNS